MQFWAPMKHIYHHIEIPVVPRHDVQKFFMGVVCTRMSADIIFADCRTREAVN